MKLAFHSRAPGVDKYNRWIASLSDGTTVFEDKIPHEISAWRRLQKYVTKHKLNITQLRLEAYGRFVNLLKYRSDENKKQVDGYWHGCKIGHTVGGLINYQWEWKGIGYIQNNIIYIVWIRNDGKEEVEERPYKKEDFAVILNHD